MKASLVERVSDWKKCYLVSLCLCSVLCFSINTPVNVVKTENVSLSVTLNFKSNIAIKLFSRAIRPMLLELLVDRKDEG